MPISSEPSSPLLSDFLGTILSFLSAVILAGMVETLFYGIHVIVFYFCILILLRKGRSSRSGWFITISAIVMFAISTADIALTFRILTFEIIKLSKNINDREFALLIACKDPLFVANNFMAELILLYRCYIVWSRSRYVLIGCSLLVLADTIWGFLGLGTMLFFPDGSPFVSLYIWSIFTINIVLMMATVARIYWVSKKARGVAASEHRKFDSLQTVIAIMMESSLVYSACILIYLLFPAQSRYKAVITVICMRVVAIMPTLLLVRVALDRIVRETIGSSTPDVSEIDIRTGLSSIAFEAVMSSTHQPETEPVSESKHDEEADAFSHSSANAPTSPPTATENKRPSSTTP